MRYICVHEDRMRSTYYPGSSINYTKPGVIYTSKFYCNTYKSIYRMRTWCNKHCMNDFELTTLYPPTTCDSSINIFSVLESVFVITVYYLLTSWPHGCMPVGITSG